MRLTALSIRNYRCIESVDLELDGYTALVGANGAGKSSILYALNWFFNGYDLEASDLTQTDGQSNAGRVEVTATFSDLTERDRSILREYGRGEQATFRRSWAPGEKGTKVVGRALQGPGFNAFYSATGIATIRAAYRKLQAEHPDLPELSGSFSKKDAEFHLSAWEDRPENRNKLVGVEDVDANHMFGFYGGSAIRKCMQFILVPAATDMQAQLSDGAKGSAITELLGAVVKNAGDVARDAWLEEHKAVVEALNEKVKSQVGDSVNKRSESINRNLKQIIPNASVKFNPKVPSWTPKGESSIVTDVTIDGITNDIARQGHGVQRSILIALFQALAESQQERLADTEPDSGPLGGAERDNVDGPALMLCIEEPEIYQHPVRARSFGRVLGELADQISTQVVVATHSPYFVAPMRFQSIRRIRTEDGLTKLSSTTVSDVSIRANAQEDQVLKTVEKQLPTRFSEGFFADAVVVVEGDTDRVILETLAERLDAPLDAQGITILDLGGKGSLRIPFEILQSLNIPTYVIADGDADGSKRVNRVKDGESLEEKRAEVEASHRKSTERLLSWLPTESAVAKLGKLPYTFGEPSVVTTQFSLWRDDLESELEKWPSFVQALQENGGKLREKNAIAYRVAVQDADISDVPDSLKLVVAQISAGEY